MSAKVFPKLALGLLVLIAFPAVTVAQTTQRKTILTGKVLDPNRAAIPSADIWISGSGLSSSAITDANGEFSLLLSPGEYQVRAMAEGFAELTQTVNLTSLRNSQSI